MNVLALNPGSNSLKFQLVDAEPQTWGQKSSLAVTIDEPFPVESRQQAVERLLKFHVFEEVQADRIACRVVYGGPLFREPVLVTEEILSRIESLNELAPISRRFQIRVWGLT